MIPVRRYAFTSPNLYGDIVFGYDAYGSICSYVINAEITTKQLQFMAKNFPVFEESLQELVNKITGAEVRPLPSDLTFERFWEIYGLKEGKMKAERAWNGLTEAEKGAAIGYIAFYKQKLAQSGVAQCHATTYINQKRWVR